MTYKRRTERNTVYDWSNIKMEIKWFWPLLAFLWKFKWKKLYLFSLPFLYFGCAHRWQSVHQKYLHREKNVFKVEFHVDRAFYHSNANQWNLSVCFQTFFIMLMEIISQTYSLQQIKSLIFHLVSYCLLEYMHGTV